MKKSYIGNANLDLLLGLSRYDKPTATGLKYDLSRIEPWKFDRITNFTLALPNRDNIMAICRQTKDVENLSKVALIGEETKLVKDKKTGKQKEKVTSYIEFFTDIAGLNISDTPVGYLEMHSGNRTEYYKFEVRPVPDKSGCEAVIFVDGSSGGDVKIECDGKKYELFGGAYQIYYNDTVVDSTTDLAKDENFALKGISPKVGNVYGELSAAVFAMKRADELGIKSVKIYYDCEQIGSFAPGGVFEKANTPITKKYVDFCNSVKFENLTNITLVHVDAHTKFDLNNAIDALAKQARDDVKAEFDNDEELRAYYLNHSNDYV